MSQSSERKNISLHQSGTKIDTRERIAAANARLNGMDIVDYIELKMAESGDESVSERKLSRKNCKVNSNAENLCQSYSVKRHIADSKKNEKIFAQSKPTTFHTEGTPIEISRCTSLSDLTIDSESKSFEFCALTGKLALNSLVHVDDTNSENNNNSILLMNSGLENQCFDQLEAEKKVGARSCSSFSTSNNFDNDLNK